MFCPKCGKENLDDAKFCTQCGAPLSYTSSSQQQGHYSSALVAQPVTTREVLKKSRLVACLLCGFLGGLGVHRFYVGKIGTGILWLFTLGFLGIGTLIDFILIVAGSFTDKEGKKLLKWITEEA